MDALIRRALEGDKEATRRLVALLTPSIRTAVSQVLSRGRSPRREARQEVEDVTQTVLLSLFADRGATLLEWDASRGLCLEAFVSLVAKRHTVSLLRSLRKSPWTEDPTLHEDLDRNAVPRMGPESEVISRDMLAALTAAVRARFTPKGLELFELMFLQGLPAEEVASATGLSIEAVYAWKSRISRQVRAILLELAPDESSDVPSSRESAPSSHPSRKKREAS